MGFFALRTFSGNTWPEVPNAAAAPVWAAYLELDRTQWLDRAALEAGQLAQVRTLLAHCWDNVPYYRQVMEATGIRPNDVQSMDDFRRLPLLPRRTYHELFPQFCAATLPAGMRVVRKGTTSGTSGVPVEVRYTDRVDLWWTAFYLRDCEWCGIDQRGTLAVIRASTQKGAALQPLLAGVVVPHWNPDLKGIIATGPCHYMDIHQDAHRQLEWLCRVRPHCLLSFPSHLDYLAGRMLEQEERLPGLQAVVTISETVTEQARARIQEAFSVSLKDIYSCSEAGYVASTCPKGHGLHVHAENVLLEVLDEHDRPCGPGQTGRVLLTTLHNFQTPFIRYDIQDEATVGPQACPCGRGLQLLTRVLGRRHPMLRLPDGRMRIATGLVPAIRDVGGCHQFQIVQRAADHVQVRVVPSRSWRGEHAEQITKVVREFFEAAVRVDVRMFDQLQLPPNGKLRVVVDETQPVDRGGAPAAE
jgi:phenylacetate-CoA ligase